MIGQFGEAQNTLDGFDDSMRELPKAHAQLAQTMCRSNPDFSNLEALLAGVERLNKFYESVE